MKIGLDIDGCILNTYLPFVQEMNKRKGTNYQYSDITSYGMDKIFPITKEELVDIFASLDDKELPLLDANCPRVIDELRAENIEVELISAHIPTKTGGLEDLITCLDLHKVNYDYIVFVDNKDPNAKGKMAHMYDFILDDAPHHIKACAQFTKAVLYYAPYNLNEYLPMAYASVWDWEQFKELVLK